jgi:hypothetical protein
MTLPAQVDNARPYVERGLALGKAVARHYPGRRMKANFQELGGTKLWVPAPDKTQSQTGARFTVFLKHSELLGPEISAQKRYWQLLQEVPVVNAVGVTSSSAILFAGVCTVTTVPDS